MNMFNQFAPAQADPDRVKWGPEVVGDTLTGWVARVAVTDDKFNPGEKKLVMDIDGATAYVQGGMAYQPPAKAVVWPTGGACQAMADAGVGDNGGDFIQLTLVELRESGKGNPFKVFTCEVLQRANPVIQSHAPTPVQAQAPAPQPMPQQVQPQPMAQVQPMAQQVQPMQPVPQQQVVQQPQALPQVQQSVEPFPENPAATGAPQGLFQ